MKVPYSWIKDFVDIDISPIELGDKLVSAGFEIEEYINLRDNIKNVVVGLVENIYKHADSNHLNICNINIGDKVIQIVTGAQNVNKGDKVPVALDGATLADGMEIKPTKMRGEMSYGMFCGGAELGINDVEYDGASNDSVLIFHEPHPNGQRIQEALGLDDVIFDIELTPNRPDCQSIIGICREAASALGQKFIEPEIESVEGEGSAEDYATVTVANPILCPRYCARVVTDLKIEPSPKWMQLRLKLVGLRPINNIVDITNFYFILL